MKIHIILHLTNTKSQSRLFDEFRQVSLIKLLNNFKIIQIIEKPNLNKLNIFIKIIKLKNTIGYKQSNLWINN